jgi:hypothetical protein
MANEITTNEYQKYVQLREQIAKGIEEADSEFMLTTYSMLHSVMNKRQKAAMQLNLRVENAAIREKREKKREALRSKSNTPESGIQPTFRSYFWELASEAGLHCRDDHILSFIEPLRKPFSIQTAECGFNRDLRVLQKHNVLILFSLERQKFRGSVSSVPCH